MSALGEDATLDEDVITEILLRLYLRAPLPSRPSRRGTASPPTPRSSRPTPSGAQPSCSSCQQNPDGITKIVSTPSHSLSKPTTSRRGAGVSSITLSIVMFTCWQGTWLDLMPPACRGNLLALCGFSRHGPSGEHRFLVLANERQIPKIQTNMPFLTGSAAHYVFNFSAATVSSEAPRRLGPVPENVLVKPYCSQNQPPRHLYHRGKLHWTTHPQATSTGNKILAFDTLSEEFRLISCPEWPRGRYSYLHDLCLMELHDRLAITTTLLCGDFMELWMLEDYDDDDRSWSHRFRIQLPPPFCVRWTMGSGIPSVILVGSYMEKLAAVYHLTEKWSVEKIGFINSNTSARHFLFKESLVPHAFFDPY
uniref:Uncharacterized protein n=1 Tax=Aegilops tauschii TaxID=37682 RepID=M8C2G9_AEGTA